MRVRVTPMNDEVADVGNPIERVGKDYDQVAPRKKRVRQQKERPGKTQPPKRHRHHHLFASFSGVPLHEKPGEKNEVAQPANHLPPTPLDPYGVSVPKQQMMQPVHDDTN